MPTGEYHMWDFGDQSGGGIRGHEISEIPGSIPYVEVPDIKKAYNRAIIAGALERMPPQEVPASGGWIAMV
jgi:predicted enzyme related to lactoylglutathione lyase